MTIQGTATTVSRGIPFTPARPLLLGLERISYELKVYFRQLDTVFFTFFFPIMMLLIFASAFSATEYGPPGDTITAAQLYLPAMLAAGVLISGVQNLGIDIAMERGDGTLKRVAGTPLPVLSYFIGKFGQVLITGIVQAALMLAVAVLAFGVTLPETPEAWLTFAWVYLLGLTTSALLGIAISRLPRSGKSASAVVLPPVLLLQFISGVYLPYTLLPDWLMNIAAVFPLKWIAEGMRSVFLPESFAALEAGGVWNHTGIALALGIWLVLGLALTLLTFRWIKRS